MSGIFISYRREDSAGYAGRLFDPLKKRFGDQVFMDVSGIDYGDDFVDAIEKAVGACDVLLAVIGREWLTIKNEKSERRLDDPNDFVRLEIATALKRGIKVIPVLVEGANPPRDQDLPDNLKPLARRNAVVLRHERWDADVGNLLERLAKMVTAVKGDGGSSKKSRSGFLVTGLTLLALALGVGGLGLWYQTKSPTEPPKVVHVPNVIGEPLTEAKTKLSADGLAPGAVTYKESSTAAEDEVLEQSPLPGAHEKKGESLLVDLVVARKPLTPPQLKPGTIFRDRLQDGSEGPEMVVIPAGEFLMGSPATEALSDERPRHPVRIAQPFALGRHEVTVGEFRRFVDATGYRTEAEQGTGCHTWTGSKFQEDANGNWRTPGFAQGEEQPVVCVSWNDARKYVEWLSAQTGRHYRLPSEAEWEYAARAGTRTARYWGEASGEACGYANVADRSAQAQFPDWTGVHACEDGQVYTAPAGSYRQNAFGLHDMLGNVSEWTEDCWHENYDGAPADGKAWLEGGECGRRVVRGGSWYSKPELARSANRSRFTSVEAGYNLGFRLARTL